VSADALAQSDPFRFQAPVRKVPSLLHVDLVLDTTMPIFLCDYSYLETYLFELYRELLSLVVVAFPLRQDDLGLDIVQLELF
jgi:hypothetical protein